MEKKEITLLKKIEAIINYDENSDRVDLEYDDVLFLIELFKLEEEFYLNPTKKLYKTIKIKNRWHEDKIRSRFKQKEVVKVDDEYIRIGYSIREINHSRYFYLYTGYTRCGIYINEKTKDFGIYNLYGSDSTTPVHTPYSNGRRSMCEYLKDYIKKRYEHLDECKRFNKEVNELFSSIKELRSKLSK